LYGARTNIPYNDGTFYNGINFLAVNSDNTFAWRKTDPSAGAGQNYVYIRGIGQMKTSRFVAHPTHFLNQMT